MDRMLAEITPEQFDEWMEMHRIVPFGDEKICRVLAMGFAEILNRMVDLSPFVKGGQEIRPDQFLFWQDRKKKKRKSQPVSREQMNPNQAATMFRMVVGDGRR